MAGDTAFTERELDVMSVLWRKGSGTVAEVKAALSVELGWEIPLTSLGYWVRALPDPTMQAEQFFEPSGRLGRLQQDGWDINYNRYQAVDGVAWPAKLRLQRDDIAVRLVIDQWQPGAPAAGMP